MNLADLRLFLEVTEAGSFTKVAANRHTAQSHISRQIGDLERECGAPLFRRTGRGVVLTEFGHYAERRIRAWLREGDALFADILQTSKLPMGEVRVGVLPSAAHPLMTQVFNRLHAQYPEVRLNVREGQGGELDALLDTGSVDMAILFRYDKPASRDETLLATAPTYLVSQPGLPLTQADTIEFKRLQGVPLVLPRQPSHWRSILDEVARSKGFSLQPKVQADSLRVQREVIASNRELYALLGPFSVEEDLRLGRLQAARVVAPDLRRYVSLALPKQGHLTEAGRVVNRLIRETVDAWGGRLNPPPAPVG